MLSRRMKALLAVAAGQDCHCRSSGFTAWPSWMSFFAISTSTVGSFSATGRAGAGLLSKPLARYAATPPAPSAMTRTTMRAVFMRFYSYAGHSNRTWRVPLRR
ncbi:hypothetical protein ACVWZR_003761 [Bradyrhizobium sp. i1.3.1]